MVVTSFLFYKKDNLQYIKGLTAVVEVLLFFLLNDCYMPKIAKFAHFLLRVFTRL